MTLLFDAQHIDLDIKREKPLTQVPLSNFIAGRRIPDPQASLFEVINPATGKVIYHVEESSPDMLTKALQHAKAGFEVWSNFTPLARSRILLNAARLLRDKNDELAAIEVADTGKPWQEACAVDVCTGADAIEYFANLIPSMTGEQQPIGDDFFYTRREPLGICAGIGAWNYPLQIACWKAAPALAAGNCMIFKPSELTPKGAVMLAEIFSEAGLPAGVFSVLHGDARVGEALTMHPDIAKVSFTGEVSTGKKVMSNAANTLKSVTMELGGKSPLIVFEDANLDDAVSGAMLGNFYTQGEVCTNGTRVFVHRPVYDEFIARLIRRTEQNIVIGDPMDPKTNFGALISEEHLQKVLGYVNAGQRDGANLLHGGIQLHPPGCEAGFFVAPTIFDQCHDAMSIAVDEIFGPVMAILVFDDETEVIARANNTELGLSAGVFTQNLTRAHRVIKQLEAGICWINTWGNSPVEMPVGGYKQSGIGRENGIQTLHQYTQTKAVYVSMQSPQSPF